VTTPARNPFYHQDNPAGSSPFVPEMPGTAAAGKTPVGGAGMGDGIARVERVERVVKPWGQEEIFAVLEGQYVGKILHIKAGGVLSLQQHRAKDETIAVEAGQITMEYGSDPGRLTSVTMNPGDRLLIRALVVHRITAITDSRVLEASTAREGWRKDIVRFDDRYGRKGTTAP
jgi:mannose-6-phosphate isomerase